MAAVCNGGGGNSGGGDGGTTHGSGNSSHVMEAMVAGGKDIKGLPLAKL